MRVVLAEKQMKGLEIPHQSLIALCQHYGVAQLYLFGSVLTQRFDPSRSDIDALVTLLPAPPIMQGEALLGLWEALEALFGRRVDLLTPDSLRNPILIAEIERTKKLVYDATQPEIPA